MTISGPNGRSWTINYLYKSKYTMIAPAKHGMFSFFLNDDPIGTSLGIYGEWAEQEFDVIDKLITTDSNCLDIGANVGTHTIPLAKKCYKGFTFAIEPQFYIFQNLNTNIFINDCSNVIPYNVGISNDIDFTVGAVYNPSNIQGFNYGQFKITERAEEGIGVSCVKLDQLELYGKSIDFIKMDVESHECSALLSGKQIITTDKPHMYIEFNDDDGNDEMLKILKQYGYNCYWHQYTKHNPNNHNKAKTIWADNDVPKTVDTINNWYEANLIAIHKSKDTGMFSNKINLGDNLVKYLQRNKLIS